MVKAQTIINCIEKFAPKNLAESWDNVGLQVGSTDKEVEKLFLCLDLTELALKKAIAEKADMIITHHPLIFKPLKKIDLANPLSFKIAQIIQNKMIVYSAHTNLDIASGGINDVLAEKLALQKTSVLGEIIGTDQGLGRIGYLSEPISLVQFVQKVKSVLNLEQVRIVGNLDSQVKKIAICGGSGSSLLFTAAFKGADLLLTGDIKYHEARAAEDLGLVLLDAGHDLTEQVILPVLHSYLEGELRAQVEISTFIEKPVFQTI